ncbi:hypothetical protein [Variovorax sp. KK3]|uniref:hypothetical protein n=1 Tax=Variovorax sp. KK3 TaxID=1855728 RepID=UPI00097BB93E|nr:hypothetical protein [Variovorax sp. KK3]
MLSARLYRAVGIVLLPPAVLGACQVSQDPRDGGFISGVAGITSGSYQQRIDTREGELRSLADMRTTMQRRLEDVDAERRSAQSEARSLRATLDELARQAEKSRRELAALQNARQVRKERLAELLEQQQSITREVVAIQQRNTAMIQTSTSTPAPAPAPVGAPSIDRSMAEDKAKTQDLAARQRVLDNAIAEFRKPGK